MQTNYKKIGFIFFKNFIENETKHFKDLNDDICNHIYQYLVYCDVDDINIYYDRAYYKRGRKIYDGDVKNLNFEYFIKSFYCCLYYKHNNGHSEHVIPYLRNDIEFFTCKNKFLNDTIQLFKKRFGDLNSLLCYLHIDEYIRKDLFYVIHYYNKDNSLNRILHHCMKKRS